MSRPLGRAADRLPLRIKLVATVLALVVGALVAADVGATTLLSGYLLGRIDSQLRTSAPPMIGRVDHGPGPDGGGDRFGLPGGYYVAVTDQPGGSWRQVSDPAGSTASPPSLPTLTPVQAAGRRDEPFTVAARAGHGRWRVLVVPLEHGSGSVAIAADLTDLNNTVGRLQLLELVIGLIVLAVLGGLAYLVVRRSLRPLAEVEQTAAAIAGGDLTQRVPEHDPRTEVGRLSAALNAMLTQIESAFRVREASEQAARASEDRMRRFVTDASHELRTPLTSIRGFAELYRQGAASGPEDVSRYLRRIEDAAARMGLLVDDLLLLARLDQQRPLEREPVDLLALASDAVHEFQAATPGRPLKLQTMDGPVPPVVLGDSSRLRQILGNLISNAITHTPDGTPVIVRVGSRGVSPATDPAAAEAVIEVIDTGPGLAPDQAERVFERFYRADPSRTRSSGGTGLGLSIVAALTAAHGGRVEVDTELGRGATFRILLPIAALSTPASAVPSIS
ncbi:MAG: HAMP domain-containing histidine kinase [Actinomycetota bacterium]|nr:HAMP domain-containing histidine kinase [Actinomycetota bacterium]